MNKITKQLIFILLAGILSAPAAWAKDSAKKKAEEETQKIGDYTKEGIDVVQGRVFQKVNRVEFSLIGGIIPNNQWLTYETFDARLAYHFAEGLGFEGSFTQALSQERAIINDLRSIPCPSPNSDLDGDGNPDSNCGIELENAPDPLQRAYFGNVIWSPIYGKMALFSKKVLYFDIYFLAGAGMFQNKRSDRFAFDVGLGWKVFINEWMSARVEVKDIIVREAAPFNHVVNNLLVQLGVSFFFPFHSGK